MVEAYCQTEASASLTVRAQRGVSLGAWRCGCGRELRCPLLWRECLGLTRPIFVRGDENRTKHHPLTVGTQLCDSMANQIAFFQTRRVPILICSHIFVGSRTGMLHKGKAGTSQHLLLALVVDHLPLPVGLVDDAARNIRLNSPVAAPARHNH